MFNPLLLSALFIMFVTTTSIAQAAPMTLENLFSSFADVKTDKKNFTEEQLDPFLDIRTQKQGYLVYRSPSPLTLHYLTPIKGDIIFTENQVKINFPQRTLTLSPNDSHLTILSQTLLNLLNGNLDQLRKQFTLQFLPLSNQNWQLTLSPKETLNKHLKPIVVKGFQQNITEILITKTSGEWRKLSFGHTSNL